MGRNGVQNKSVLKEVVHDGCVKKCNEDNRDKEVSCLSEPGWILEWVADTKKALQRDTNCEPTASMTHEVFNLLHSHNKYLKMTSFAKEIKFRLEDV